MYIHRSLATKGTHEAASDAEFSSTTRFHRSTRVRKSCSATCQNYLLIIVNTIVNRRNLSLRFRLHFLYPLSWTVLQFPVLTQLSAYNVFAHMVTQPVHSELQIFVLLTNGKLITRKFEILYL